MFKRFNLTDPSFAVIIWFTNAKAYAESVHHEDFMFSFHINPIMIESMESNTLPFHVKCEGVQFQFKHFYFFHDHRNRL